MLRSTRSIVGTAALIGLTLAGTVGPAFAADSRFYWTGGGGDSNWHNGDNWFSEDAGTTGFVPADDWVTINNGQTVNADIANGVIEPTGVMVGKFPSLPSSPLPTGTNTLNVVGQSISPDNRFQIGLNDGVAIPDIAGELNVTGGSVSFGDAVFAQIGVAFDDIGGSSVIGTVNIDGGFTGPSHTLSNLYIGDYINSVGLPLSSGTNIQPPTLMNSGHAVGQLTVGAGIHHLGDILIGRHHNYSSNTTGSASGHLRVNAGGMTALQEIIGGELVSHSYMAVGTALGSNSNATGTADITGDIVNFVELFIAYAGDATTHASGHVTLRDSHAEVEFVNIAETYQGAESADGSLTLNPSLLDTQNLEAHEGSTLNLYLTGGSRVTPYTVGDAGTYAAIDADEALLKGTVAAHFDYVPVAGTHHYDLLVTDSLSALDDATMLPGDFQVFGLNSGFSIDFFGIVEDGVDKVRLTISGSPILIGDLDGDGFVGIADINIVLGNWNQSVTPGTPLEGDPSGDGFVGIEDLNAVLGNWNAGKPPLDGAPVPEPTSGLLLLGASGALCASRRRAC